MQGILFNHDYGMFQGVVSGIKTETRRLQIEGKKPRFKVGEIVFLKEPYKQLTFEYPKEIKGKSAVIYKYDAICGTGNNIKWKNKMFMPEKYARHYIEITEVVSERLNEITEDGAIAEGIIKDGKGWKSYDKIPSGRHKGQEHPFNSIPYNTAFFSYMSLWETINGVGSQIINPMVWVYKFKLLK